MNKITDYLLMKSPGETKEKESVKYESMAKSFDESIKDEEVKSEPAVNPPEAGNKKEEAPTDPKQKRRIALSIIGLIVGIFCSFIITGIEKSAPQENKPEISVSPASQQDQTPQVREKPGFVLPGLKEILPLFIISLIICMLSYQGLYASLKMYNNEPAFLILFVAFQYGFFWESVVKGVGTLV